MMCKLQSVRLDRMRAVLLIATTYFYFLIFAQFGFLHLVSEFLGREYWNPVLGAMGISGLLGALWAGFKFQFTQVRRWLWFGYAGAALGAMISLFVTSAAYFAMAAAISGFSLAVLTVALVGYLSGYFPVRRLGLLCGIGTGIAYFLSNVPVIFEASGMVQSVLAVGACAVGAANVPFHLNMPARDPQEIRSSLSMLPVLGAVLVFTVLIWTDSAAFTLIQETPALKAASWSGSGQLWMIGGTHLVAAIYGGWLMDRGHAAWLYVFAFVGLAVGLFGLNRQLADVLPALVYAASVSFYSVALVAFALLRQDFVRPVRVAGVVFALAGWLGSGMGIGMVHDLEGVPLLFWVLSAVFLLTGVGILNRKVLA